MLFLTTVFETLLLSIRSTLRKLLRASCLVLAWKTVRQVAKIAQLLSVLVETMSQTLTI